MRKLWLCALIAVFTAPAVSAFADIPNGIYSLTRIICERGRQDQRIPTWIMTMVNGNYMEFFEMRDDKGKPCILHVQGTYAVKSGNLVLTQALASDCNAVRFKNKVTQRASFPIIESWPETFVIHDANSGICPGAARLHFEKIISQR